MGSTRGATAAPVGSGADATRTPAGRGLRAPWLMAGIQYSTARTDATHAEATGAFPFPSSLRGRRAARRRTIRSRTLLAGTRANLRSAAAKNPPAGELPHMAHARATLRHRCDAEEEPMTDLAALGSDRSDDRTGVSGLGAIPHRMTLSIFMPSFAAPTA